jgi:hypothetical protein
MANAKLLALMPLWAAWMRSETVGKGYPTCSAFLASGGASSADSFDHLCSNADRVAVVTLDALIDDLPTICRAAVHHRWLHAVFRFRPEVMPAALVEAYETLESGMRRWGMW